MNLDGEPIWSPIKDNDLKYAVNTNWDLFQHAPTSTYYLRNDASWLKASDVKGPWTAAGAGKLPDSFNKLPAEENWKDVKAALPGKTIPAGQVPKVFVSFQPAELILLTGEPKYVQVPGTALFWVSNTDSDVFRMGKTGLVYYLVAGRWFSAQDFTGPWTFATPSLPDDFKKIPLEHERSRVLASVPGTDRRRTEAVLLAQIPADGASQQEGTEGTGGRVPGRSPIPADRADDGTARGQHRQGRLQGRRSRTTCATRACGSSAKPPPVPWEVASSVPQQIYEIPVSSPAHHVTYVTIEEDNDDDWVVYRGSRGLHRDDGRVGLHGLGIGLGTIRLTMVTAGYYPYYYPHFPTYGYSAWYNPWTGAYGRSARVYGPYGGAGVGARYNPRTGTYARGAAAYGPVRRARRGAGVQPAHRTYAQTRQGSNVYGSWGSTSVQRGDDWAKTNRYTNNRTGNTTRTVRTDEGNAVTRKGADGGRVAAGSGGRHLRRKRRQRVSQERWHLAEVRQRRMAEHAKPAVR